MTGKILVAYATRYGSTCEVAEAAAKTLRERGLDADVVRAKGVRELTGYDAVLLATPFYIGSMLKDAAKFLDANREALIAIPVAILACGPLAASDDMVEARKQLDTAMSKFDWLRPVAAEMFVGKYDPEHLSALDKLVAVIPASPLHGIPARDERDWDAIAAWVGTLPVAMGLASA